MNKECLKTFNTNIIKWYSFKSNSKILCVNANEAVIDFLSKKNLDVTVYKADESIKSVFDYILICDYEKIGRIVLKIKEFLSEQGKLLIFGKNNFSLNDFCRYDLKACSGISSLSEASKTFSDVKNELKACGFERINRFYVFPNCFSAELILNEKLENPSGYLDKFTPEILDNEIRVFDEIKALKALTENSAEMLDIFADSYFAEVSLKSDFSDVKYVSFNNCRKEKYRLMTVIRENRVEKYPAEEAAREHIYNIGKTIDDLKSFEDIKIIDNFEKDFISSEFIKNYPLLDGILAEHYNDFDFITDILNRLRNVLLKYSQRYSMKIRKIFPDKDKEMLKKLHYMPKCPWDMVAKNCFYNKDDGTFIFFDQEWECDFLPAEFLIYRSVINSYELVKKIDVDLLLKKLGIFEFKDFFSEIDGNLRKEIIDENILKAEQSSVKGIDNLINDNLSLLEDLKNKNVYIKNLEQYAENLKNDNENKQQYILNLENMLKQKKGV